jgi:hypothetical protein
MKRTTLLVTVGVSVLALLAVVVGKGGGMIVIANRVRVVVVMVCALAVAGGLLTLALLEKPAQAQAETITTQNRSTFNQTVFNFCTGEVFFIQGTLHTVAHTTIDETGVFHTKFQFSAQGQGESDSGAKYVLHSVSNLHENSTPEPANNLNFTVTETAKLIRQGSAMTTDDLQVRFFTHVTLNEHGEVTAEVVKFERVCT